MKYRAESVDGKVEKNKTSNQTEYKNRPVKPKD